MTQSNFDLSSLFGAALQAMTDNRQQVNNLDGYNGNHGDNMVENLRIITEALQAHQTNSPSDALQSASRQLQARGRGGTSPHYARGLEQAAVQLQGRPQLEVDDVASLLQALLGSVPVTGGQPAAPAGPAGGEGVAESLMGMIGGQPPQSANVLQELLGMATGGAAPARQPVEAAPDAGDLIEKLLPAGMAFLQAKQAGADNVSAGRQALIGALLGGALNPVQATSPRSAAGGLLAQGMLKAILGR